MIKIPVAITLKPIKPIMHKIACKHCPSANYQSDPESQEMMKWPHEERVKAAFPCAWNNTRYCKGYCDEMGVTNEDLKNFESEN